MFINVVQSFIKNIGKMFKIMGKFHQNSNMYAAMRTCSTLRWGKDRLVREKEKVLVTAFN